MFKAMTGFKENLGVRQVMLYISPVYANYDRLIFTSFNLGADTRSVLIQRFLNVSKTNHMQRRAVIVHAHSPGFNSLLEFGGDYQVYLGIPGDIVLICSRGDGSYEKLGVQALVREKFSTIFKQFQDHSQPNIGCAAAHPAHLVPPPRPELNMQQDLPTKMMQIAAIQQIADFGGCIVTVLSNQAPNYSH